MTGVRGAQSISEASEGLKRACLKRLCMDLIGDDCTVSLLPQPDPELEDLIRKITELK